MPRIVRFSIALLLLSLPAGIVGCTHSTRCLTGRDFFPCAIERCAMQSAVERPFEMHVTDTEGTPQPADIYLDGELIAAGLEAGVVTIEFDWADERYGWIPRDVEVRTSNRQPVFRRLQFNDCKHQAFYVPALD
ncbi:MAG: hypothetical protein RL885_12740 [Planctomycetota bacterium]